MSDKNKDHNNNQQQQEKQVVKVENNNQPKEATPVVEEKKVEQEPVVEVKKEEPPVKKEEVKKDDKTEQIEALKKQVEKLTKMYKGNKDVVEQASLSSKIRTIQKQITELENPGSTDYKDRTSVKINGKRPIPENINRGGFIPTKRSTYITHL